MGDDEETTIESKAAVEDLKLLIESIKYQEEDLKFQEQALRTMASLFRTSDNASSYLVHSNGLEYILRIMMSTNNTPNSLREACLHALCAACENNGIVQQALSTKEIFCMLKRFTLMKSKTRLQTLSCYLLICLMTNNEKGQILARKTKCIETLRYLFKDVHSPTCSPRFPKRRTECFLSDDQQNEDLINLWQTATNALSVCVNNPQNSENQIFCSSAFPAAVAYLRNCDSSAIQITALSFLTNCLANNSRSQVSFRLVGGLRALCDVFREELLAGREIPSSVLKGLVLTIEAAVCDNDMCRDSIAELEIVPLLLQSLQLCFASPKFKVHCLITLATCIEGCESNCKQFFSSEGMSIVVSLLAENQNCEELQKAATCVLHTYLEETKSTVPKIMDKVLSSELLRDNPLLQADMIQKSKRSLVQQPEVHRINRENKTCNDGSSGVIMETKSDVSGEQNDLANQIEGLTSEVRCLKQLLKTKQETSATNNLLKDMVEIMNTACNSTGLSFSVNKDVDESSTASDTCTSSGGASRCINTCTYIPNSGPSSGIIYYQGNENGLLSKNAVGVECGVNSSIKKDEMKMQVESGGNLENVERKKNDRDHKIRMQSQKSHFAEKQIANKRKIATKERDGGKKEANRIDVECRSMPSTTEGERTIQKTSKLVSRDDVANDTNCRTTVQSKESYCIEKSVKNKRTDTTGLEDGRITESSSTSIQNQGLSYKRAINSPNDGSADISHENILASKNNTIAVKNSSSVEVRKNQALELKDCVSIQNNIQKTTTDGSYSFPGERNSITCFENIGVKLCGREYKNASRSKSNNLVLDARLEDLTEEPEYSQNATTVTGTRSKSNNLVLDARLEDLTEEPEYSQNATTVTGNGIPRERSNILDVKNIADMAGKSNNYVVSVSSACYYKTTLDNCNVAAFVTIDGDQDCQNQQMQDDRVPSLSSRNHQNVTNSLVDFDKISYKKDVTGKNIEDSLGDCGEARNTRYGETPDKQNTLPTNSRVHRRPHITAAGQGTDDGGQPKRILQMIESDDIGEELPDIIEEPLSESSDQDAAITNNSLPRKHTVTSKSPIPSKRRKQSPHLVSKPENKMNAKCLGCHCDFAKVDSHNFLSSLRCSINTCSKHRMFSTNLITALRRYGKFIETKKRSPDFDFLASPKSNVRCDDSPTEIMKEVKKIKSGSRFAKIPFSPKEIDVLKQGVEMYGSNFSIIQKNCQFSTKRSARTLKQKYKSITMAKAKDKKKPCPFSTQEEYNLKDGVSRYGCRWKHILDHYNFKKGRTPDNLKDKWRYCLKSR